MAHKNAAFHAEMESKGVVVIVGHDQRNSIGSPCRYLVRKWSEFDEHGVLVDIVDGDDKDGKPKERLNGAGGETDPATVTYLSPDHACDIYYGNTQKEVEDKIKAKTPDYRKEKGEKNVKAIAR